jgi:biopolymer transport protein ExbD
MGNKRLKPGEQAKELDLKCFMNLMVVLIPMLLLSAEFAKVAIIEIRLPENRGSSTRTEQTEQTEEDRDEKLLLTAIITDSVVTLGARGGFLPSIFYREFHRYLTMDGLDTLIEYVKDVTPRHPSGRDLTVYERFDIFLYVVNDARDIVNVLYSQHGELVTNADNGWVTSVNVGDTVFALSTPRRRIVVSDPGAFVTRPLSAYDELRNRLMGVKELFQEASDNEDIIIVAENYVIYDKIVQIMDAARAAEFPNISIAKFRG